MEQNGREHRFNWELASSAEDPVEDGGSSKELQPDEDQGRTMNVLSVWYTAQCKSAKGTARGHWLYGAVSDGK